MTTAITNSGSTGSPSGSALASKGIANNFDQFLNLLTTQLKNQSPLDPMDTNQFTQQLVQFSSVEQQLKMNDTLSSLLTLNKATATSNALSFVGNTITADGAKTRLANGQAAWSLNASRGGQGTITIKDANGNTVATDTVTLGSGAQSYVWNGRTSAGGTAPDGAYTLSIQAKDSSGQAVSVSTQIVGVVDQVDLSGAAPMLMVGDIAVDMGSVKSVTRK